jgi:D-alanyl-D-alanine carboxypeptidase
VLFFRPSPFRIWLRKASLNGLVLAVALVLIAPRLAHAEARLLIEADTGKVLEAENATVPWHPASLTKIMTAYVTLKAVKEGKITLDTLVTVSPLAASQPPSKMGLRSGTQLTVDNALKMMLVKSANDMAVVLAEGVGGSIDGFSAMMNDTAQKLGMTQTSYVNPNGLPDDRQITSARDLGILARAFIRDLPEYEYYVHIPAIRFGRRVTHNFNKLIGRYPGADGFKTGFICASGYNLVASATRNGKRLIAIVLGASSGTMRSVRAAQMLEHGFASESSLGWLRPSLGKVADLAPVDTPPPDLHDEVCGGKHHKRPSDEDDTIAGNDTSPGSGDSNPMAFTSAPQPKIANMAALIAAPAESTEPVVVYTGPTRTGAALAAAVAADEAKQAPPKRRAKKSRVAVAKPNAAGDVKGDAKDKDAKATGKEAKPGAKAERKAASVKHAKPKPDASAKKLVAEKHTASAADTATKPVKRKSAGRPKAATEASKPARKGSTSDSKPAS